MFRVYYFYERKKNLIIKVNFIIYCFLNGHNDIDISEFKLFA
jgi:hypothetical protein